MLSETVRSLGEYIDHLNKVPAEVRSFLGKVVQRSHRLGKAPATGASLHGVLVACSDLEGAFKMEAKALARYVGNSNSMVSVVWTTSTSAGERFGQFSFGTATAGVCGRACQVQRNRVGPDGEIHGAVGLLTAG